MNLEIKKVDENTPTHVRLLAYRADSKMWHFHVFTTYDKNMFGHPEFAYTHYVDPNPLFDMLGKPV